MKRCATCNRTYDDTSLNFCLADGAPLVDTVSEPTVVLPRPEKKKSKLLLWLGLAVLCVGAVVVVLAALLLYKFSGGANSRNDRDQANRQTVLLTPKPKVSPTPTAKPEETDASPEVDPTPSVDGSDEVTPILWDTTASAFKGTQGTTYTFECPPDGTARPIFGSDIYTDYSSICTAAVHAGVITLDGGGTVILEYRPGRTIYGSTVRHEITSVTTGEHSRSFIIRKAGD